MGNVTTLLFDLGGVLIELGSLQQMMASSPFDDQQIWKNWISSPSVRRFESGRCTDIEFAQGMINEFGLAVSVDNFLVKFNAWPQGAFGGAEELLIALVDRYRLACLSNTNISHFNHFLHDQPVMKYFEMSFLSHQTGILKPDRAAFDNVLRRLCTEPREVLFFDDNPGNIAAATDLGFETDLVNAPDDVIRALKRRGLQV